MQGAAAQPRLQPAHGPAPAALQHLGLQLLQRQALLVGGPLAGVGELHPGAPAVAFGLRLQLPAQRCHRRGRPEHGEVEGARVHVGAVQGLVGPGQHAGGERQGGGVRAGGAVGGLGLGADVERGAHTGQRAVGARLGLQRQRRPVGHAALHLALQRQRQGQRGLRAQVELPAVAPVGPLQRIEAQAVRGGHARRVGQGGFVHGRGQRGVAVVPGDVRGAQRLPARELETLQRKAQAQRQGQAQVRQRLAGCGRALVVHPQAADGQRRDVQAPALQRVGPQRVAPLQRHALGLHREAVLRPAQAADAPAAAQAAFDVVGLQAARRSVRLLGPASGPGQCLRERTGRAGP